MDKLNSMGISDLIEYLNQSKKEVIIEDGKITNVTTK